MLVSQFDQPSNDLNDEEDFMGIHWITQSYYKAIFKFSILS